jgi:hypothetical protein
MSALWTGRFYPQGIPLVLSCAFFAQHKELRTIWRQHYNKLKVILLSSFTNFRERLLLFAIGLSVCLYLCLFVSTSVCIYVCLYLRLFVSTSVCLSCHMEELSSRWTNFYGLLYPWFFLQNLRLTEETVITLSDIASLSSTAGSQKTATNFFHISR